MSQKDLVKQYLLTAGEPVSTSQIAADTDIARGSVGRILGEYAAGGEVESIDDGHPTGRKLYCWSGAVPAPTPTPAPSVPVPVVAAYHGMVASHPDDAPEIVPTADHPASTSVADALVAARAALANYRASRRDPVEDALMAAVSALATAASMENGGAKCS
jgi:hypothetical protein